MKKKKKKKEKESCLKRENVNKPTQKIKKIKKTNFCCHRLGNTVPIWPELTPKDKSFGYINFNPANDEEKLKQHKIERTR